MRRTVAFYLESIVLIVCLLVALPVLVRLLTVARATGAQAQQVTHAVQMAQDAAECFAASDTNEAFVALLGPDAVCEGEAVTWQRAGCTVRIAVSEQPSAPGTMRTAEISVHNGQQVLYTLHTEKYVLAGRRAA